MTHSRAQLRQLLDRYGLEPGRALGQNFVADPNTVRRIARLSGVTEGMRVLEIGAGLGSLTLALAEAGASVVAVEADRRLVPALRDVVAGHQVEVVHADALHVDLESLLGERDQSGAWMLVANLPYNIATPLVVRVLEDVPSVGGLFVMVQREVGERLAAGPGEPAYGAVSVKVAYWAKARVAGRIPSSVFVPRPNVDSVLLRIDRFPAPALDESLVDYDRLFGVVRAGFSQRRKTLRRALEGVVEPSAFEASGVDPRARAEDLSLREWGDLAATGSGQVRTTSSSAGRASARATRRVARSPSGARRG